MLRVTRLTAKILSRKTCGAPIGNASPIALVVWPRIDQRSFSNNDGMKAMLERLKKKKSESTETESVSPVVEVKKQSASTATTEKKEKKEEEEHKAKGEKTAATVDTATAENETTAAGAKDEATEEKKEASEPFKMPEMPEITAAKVQDFVTTSYFSFREGVLDAYDQMIGRGETTLKKKVAQAQSFRPAKKAAEDEDDDEKAKREEEERYKGSQALVHVKEPTSAWEAMKERLSDSPIIKEMLKNSRKVKAAAAATDLGKKATEAAENVKDKMADVREFWETSQNPLVYTVSGLWDNVTSETDEGLAVGAIQKLDPSFSVENWAEEVREDLVPLVISAHLRGDTKALKPWLTEAVYGKLGK